MKKNLKFLFCLLFLLPGVLSLAQGTQGVQNSQNNQNAQNPARQRQRPAQAPAQTTPAAVNNPNAGLYGAHDPEIIKQDSTYFLFTTGGSISSSTDLKNWKREKPVFSQTPSWITPDMLGGSRGGSYWAPDITYVNGTYYLYYAFSAFAKNTSVIGVATNKTLHSSDTANYKWVDHGLVVQSVPNRDMWNAIDPALIMDRNQGYLVFGSFWEGIKMVKLTPDLFSIAKPEVWYTLARQPRAFPLDDTDPGDGTIEGAFIYKHIQYFYLFVSLDYCCRGVNSDYNVVVGRSRTVEGPYVDRDGKLMSRGGGTLVAKGNEFWAGVGHCAAYTMDGKSILVMHGYDKLDNGRSKLIIREIKWDRGDWPSIDL
jgi:arabinan endo-1,5-alpha-L-arabinosidase